MPRPEEQPSQMSEAEKKALITDLVVNKFGGNQLAVDLLLRYAGGAEGLKPGLGGSLVVEGKRPDISHDFFPLDLLRTRVEFLPQEGTVLLATGLYLPRVGRTFDVFSQKFVRLTGESDEEGDKIFFTPRKDFRAHIAIPRGEEAEPGQDIEGKPASQETGLTVPTEKEIQEILRGLEQIGEGFSEEARKGIWSLVGAFREVRPDSEIRGIEIALNGRLSAKDKPLDSLLAAKVGLFLEALKHHRGPARPARSRLRSKERRVTRLFPSLVDK